jgi:hypothetical protein
MQAPSTPPTQQNDQAAICKSTNQLSQTLQQLQQCTSTADQQNMQSVLGLINTAQADFDNFNTAYNDLLLTGDNLFGTVPNTTAVSDVAKRNAELTARAAQLEKDIATLQATEERADRDFLDTKADLPERQVSNVINVIDDYTLVVFMVSFIFLVLSLGYWYISTNLYTPISIGVAIIASVLGGSLIFILTMYLF